MKLLKSLAKLGKTRKERIQVLLVGAPGVGKTSLVKDLLGTPSEHSDEYKPTMWEVHESTLKHGNQTINTTVIDTGGTYSIPAVFEAALKSADIFVLVYSVNDEKSKEFLLATLKEISVIRGDTKSLPIIIIGNKLDLLQLKNPQELFDNSKNGAFDKDEQLLSYCCNQVKVSHRKHFNLDIVKTGIFFMYNTLIKDR